MKWIIIFITILFLSCHLNKIIKTKEFFVFSDIPIENTIYINKGYLYFTSVDFPLNNYAINCNNILNNKIVWSYKVGDTQIITTGVIDDFKNYIVTTLSNKILDIDSSGKVKFIELYDRCKITPILYKNQVIVHDRGYGIRSFDTKTFKEVWNFKQETHISISQPVLKEGKLYFILDDKKIFSVKPNNGKVIWDKNLLEDRIYHIYNCTSKSLLILSIDLYGNKYLTKMSLNNGEVDWEKVVSSDLNSFERDNCIIKDKVYCRGKKKIFIYELITGKFISEINLNEEIITNIIADSIDNIYFAIPNKKIIILNTSLDKIEIYNTENEVNRIYNFENKIYLYSYPKLLFIE